MSLDLMERLKQLVQRADGVAEYRISGSVDEDNRHIVAGSVECRVPLICQRCLQEVEYPLGGEFKLALVTDEDQVDTLPEDFDPLLVAENGEIDLANLLEDELLLTVPISPRHNQDHECGLQSDSTPSTRSHTRKPFAGLADLLNKSDKS